MVDSLFSVRSDLRPSLVSFLSCLGEMTVANFLVRLSVFPAILGGMGAWRNRNITAVRQLLVPKKMAELHELQPVLRMRMILQATPPRLHATIPTLTPVYQVNNTKFLSVKIKISSKLSILIRPRSLIVYARTRCSK